MNHQLPDVASPRVDVRTAVREICQRVAALADGLSITRNEIMGTIEQPPRADSIKSNSLEGDLHEIYSFLIDAEGELALIAERIGVVMKAPAPSPTGIGANSSRLR